MFLGFQAPVLMKCSSGGPYRPASLGGAGQPLNQPRYFSGSPAIFSEMYCDLPRLPMWMIL